MNFTHGHWTNAAKSHWWSYNEVWLRQGRTSLFEVYHCCKVGNKFPFTVSPSCREILLDNTKPQHLSHTDVFLHTSVEQLQPQSNSYSITLHIAAALELPFSLAIFSKWSIFSEGIPWKLSISWHYRHLNYSCTWNQEQACHINVPWLIDLSFQTEKVSKKLQEVMLFIVSE